MITIYKSNETDFKHLGLGVLTDFKKDTTFVLRERNGQYIFEGTYPTNGLNAEVIEKGKILKMSSGPRTKGQLFDVIRTQKINNQEIKIYAQHYSYRTKRLGLKPEFGVVGDANAALTIWKNNLVGEHNFETWSDITTSNNANWRIDKMQNARNVLGGVAGSILDIWGGEYEFDNNVIRLWSSMGRKSAAAIIYGKNLTDIEQDETIDETYTSIYPYAVQDEVVYTIDELYIDSEYVNNYPQRRIAVKDFSSNFEHEEEVTQDKLRNLAKQFIKSNRVGIPKVSTEVKFVDLAQTLEGGDLREAETIELCDVLTLIFPKLGIRDNAAKVVATKWDPIKEEYISLTIGTLSNSLKSTIVDDLSGRIEKVENNTQTIMLSSNGINKIYRNEIEPKPPIGGFKVDDQWWQPNGKYMRMYFWSGDSWVKYMDTETFRREIDVEFERIDEQAKSLSKEIKDSEERISESVEKVKESAEAIEELKDRSDLTMDVIGEDGKVTYSKNRLNVIERPDPKIKGKSLTDFKLPKYEKVTVGHNGEGFIVGRPYTLSWSETKENCIGLGSVTVNFEEE
ncbi:phage tail spike protein [Facklamia sp. 7083-14-GEN3]|uniref:phage tail spike protein n=1 Tax=Facklamia sp. 7083-14-GEN3 TaxID=2973478 RepID=UPI00215CB325|nr:phage tail spike protein [Facklamia sp. 7083-14-GEN3]MCR8969268.1 phage tail protein [Facklamia sp. 7083-14-GEN3]